MDKQAFLDPQNIKVLATVNSSTWGFEARNLELGEGLETEESGIEFEQKTVMVVDPSIPYIYLPYDSWSFFQLYIEDTYRLAHCNNYDGVCAFQGTCKQVQQQISETNLTFSINVQDKYGNQAKITIPPSLMLI